MEVLKSSPKERGEVNQSSSSESAICSEVLKKLASLKKQHSEAQTISFPLAGKQNQSHILVLNPQKLIFGIAQNFQG